MDKEILNMEEAAEFFNVSIKTFIKLLKEEKVPARKIGREWRFSKSALISWLSDGDSQQYSSSESETKDFFDKVAPQWESMRGGFYDEEVVKRLDKRGILKKSMTLVELGAGNGYFSRILSSKVKKVLAVDISSKMLKELERKASEEGLKNIFTIEGDSCDLPIEDGSVDIVFSNMFLHHIEEPILAIKDMIRILRPGGKVFLADFREHSNVDLKERMHDVWQGFLKSDVMGWFEKAGFKNVLFDTVENERRAKDDNGIFIVIAEK